MDEPAQVKMFHEKHHKIFKPGLQYLAPLTVLDSLYRIWYNADSKEEDCSMGRRRLEDGYYWVRTRFGPMETRFSTELTVGKYTRREVDDPWYEFPWQLIGTDELFTEMDALEIWAIQHGLNHYKVSVSANYW